MSYSRLKRYALTFGLAAWTATAAAQEPAPPNPAAARAARPRPGGGTPVPNNPHGVKRQGPQIFPAPELPAGDIEVRLTSKTLEGIDNQEVILIDSKQSIERGNVDTQLVGRTDLRGVVHFSGQATETDHVYDVLVTINGARYSTGQFQFRKQDAGLRVVLPVYESSSSLDGLLLLTRSLIVMVPQDDLFVVDVLLRVENYGEVAWLPDNVTFRLPDGFKALTVKDPKADARFEANGDDGVKLVGTLTPGQHDLMFRYHLPTDGKSEKTFRYPTTLNTGMVRVILESSPTMKLEVAGFPDAEESRNNEGQRRLMTGRDFVTDKVHAPEDIEVKISGIPTPPPGKMVAVGLAAALALGGIAQTLGRRRSAASLRSDLSKEDRERAGELLLEELIGLEQAFAQGAIGRKTHEQAKRQLLEAYARLRGSDSEPEPA